MYVSWLNSLPQDDKNQETLKHLPGQHFPIPGLPVAPICRDDSSSSAYSLDCFKEALLFGARLETWSYRLQDHLTSIP